MNRDHYRITAIDDRTFQICEEDFVNAYLLTGTESALLTYRTNNVHKNI